jgi:hypothetical protein
MSVQNAPLCFVAQAAKLAEEVLAVFGESLRCKPRHIFEKHCGRSGFPDETERLWEEVSLVLVSELFSCNREWRARNPSCQEVDPAIISAIDFIDRCLDYFPMWTILTEGVTSMIVNLDGSSKVKASRFETCGLSSSARANLQDCWCHIPPNSAVRARV